MDPRNADTRTRCAAAVAMAGLVLLSCSAGSTNVSTGDRAPGDTTTVDEQRPRDAGDPASTVTTEEATTTTEDEDEEERATTTTEPKEAGVEVTESGFSVYRPWDEEIYGTAGAVVKNNGDDVVAFVEVVFTFVDAEGKPLGTDTSFVNAIDPGGVGHAGVEMVDLPGDAVGVEVAAVPEDDDDFWEGTVIPIQVESIAPEEYGDGATIRGVAVNETDDIIDSASVTCVVRSGGKIVGTATGYVDTIVPGSSVAWDASSPVLGDAAECSAGSMF